MYISYFIPHQESQVGGGEWREVRHKRAREREVMWPNEALPGGRAKLAGKPDHSGLAAEWQAAERGTSRSRQPRRQKAHHQHRRHRSGVPQVRRPEVRGSLADEATRTSRECPSGDSGGQRPITPGTLLCRGQDTSTHFLTAHTVTSELVLGLPGRADAGLSLHHVQAVSRLQEKFLGM